MWAIPVEQNEREEAHLLWQVAVLFSAPLIPEGATGLRRSPEEWDRSPEEWDRSPQEWDRSPQEWDGVHRSGTGVHRSGTGVNIFGE